MVLIVKGTGDFVPAPEGLHSAVCVDLVDLGMQDTPWGERHKVLLIWEVACCMEDGRPFTVRKRYTASLHEKSNLNKDLKAWRGRPFTAEELAGFDIEKILGAPCQVLVQHTEKDGSVYANVTAVMKAASGQKVVPSGQYVRVRDRDQQQVPAESNAAAEDPIPF
jgi:hypothetical protein